MALEVHGGPLHGSDALEADVAFHAGGRQKPDRELFLEQTVELLRDFRADAVLGERDWQVAVLAESRDDGRVFPVSAVTCHYFELLPLPRLDEHMGVDRGRGWKCGDKGTRWHRHVGLLA